MTTPSMKEILRVSASDREGTMTTPTPRADAIREQAYEAHDPRELWEAEYRKMESDLAAAQLVERERCAKIVEQYSVEIDGVPGTSRSLKPLADIIRSGE